MGKILITGTAGFVGHHLAIRLAKQGYTVIGLDSINEYYDVNLKYGRLAEQGIQKDIIEYGKLVQGIEGISFLQLDLEDDGALNNLFKEHKFEAVLNFAAQPGVGYSLKEPKPYINSNIMGFLNIIQACKTYTPDHLIFASSSSVYGLNDSIPFKESDYTDSPISLYAATKKANEVMAHCYAHLYNIPMTGLRLFTVYGPWARPDMALSKFTKAIIEDQPIKVFNNGDMMRDFTYVDDIVSGIEKLIGKPPTETDNMGSSSAKNSTVPYRILNLGTSNPIRLLDFVNLIEKKLGKKAIIDLLPMQPGDVKETYADMSELKKLVGYEPDTPLEYGVNQFVDWYKRFYA